MIYFSLFLIIAMGYLFGKIFDRLGLPALLGMLITGMILGPFGLNLIDTQILVMSSVLRTMALLIILIRAGLSLDLNDLRKAGKSALLLCFVPALFEMAGTVLLAPVFLGLSIIDSLLLASVLAAVSPAVIVPNMLKIMEEGYGTEKSIPQMILTGASADDILVIALFGIFSQLAVSNGFDWLVLARLPLSVVFGVATGIGLAYLLSFMFGKLHLNTVQQLLLLLSACFLLEGMEQVLNNIIGFSGLLGIMAMGIVLFRLKKKDAVRLSGFLNNIWQLAQIFLFVLVGAALNLQAALEVGPMAILLILCVLVFRSLGVFVCMIGSSLNQREKLFSVFSYLPKATVQAAIGAVPLSMGLASGNIILSIAVVSILITAPIGAWLIQKTYKRFLVKQEIEKGGA